MKNIEIQNMIHKCRHKFGDETLWCLKISDYAGYFGYFLGVMDKKEKSKVKYRSGEASRRYVLRKGIARYILAQALGSPIETVNILYTIKGKPYIEGNTVYFSISHSGDYFAVLVSDKYLVGVDIQIMKKKSIYPTLILSPKESRYMESLKEDGRYLYYWRIWTFKEAVSKITGDGMTVDFSQIEGTAYDYSDLSGQYLYPGNKQLFVKVYELKYEECHVCGVISGY